MNKTNHAEKQHQSSGASRTPISTVRTSLLRILQHLLFPFGRSNIFTKEGRGLQRATRWVYRYIWLIGIGYASSICLLPSTEPSSDHTIFNPPRFTLFSIIDKQDVSPTSVILTVRPCKDESDDNTDPYTKNWSQGTWSVEFKQPQLQVARSYTPLPPTPDMRNTSDLRFLIRRERGGEVSNYLANLPVNATVELRGPHPGVNLPKDAADVVFLAGGTGIAPAMQVVYTLLEKRTDSHKPKIHIVWANRNRVDCTGGVSSSVTRKSRQRKTSSLRVQKVVQELEHMRSMHPDHLTIDYVVDEEGTFIDQKVISVATRKSSLDISRTSSTPNLLFVSGPEGFVNFLAGPKVWEDREEKQGRLGGLLGQTGLVNWRVWKM